MICLIVMSHHPVLIKLRGGAVMSAMPDWKTGNPFLNSRLHSVRVISLGDCFGCLHVLHSCVSDYVIPDLTISIYISYIDAGGSVCRAHSRVQKLVFIWCLDIYPPTSQVVFKPLLSYTGIQAQDTTPLSYKMYFGEHLSFSGNLECLRADIVDSDTSKERKNKRSRR